MEWMVYNWKGVSSQSETQKNIYRSNISSFFFLKNLILINLMFSADVAINYSMPLYFISNIIPVLLIIHFFVHSFLYVKW